MKKSNIIIAFLFANVTCFNAQTTLAQDIDQPAPGGAIIGNGELPEKPGARPRDELEAEFKTMLAGATLVGSWQMTGRTGEDRRLGPPRTEKYTISGATKLQDDIWIIRARIQFAEQDVTIPVPVRVVWAEDTPMITLTEFSVPLLGTYSCRVIIHHGYYSGIWYSATKGYGGVMSGLIVKESSDSDDEKTETPDSK